MASRVSQSLSAGIGTHRKLILSSTVAGIALCAASPARADCVLTPTAGDDLYVCDSGTDPGGLNDPGANNRLTLPTGGSGTIDGNVTFGGGTDTVIMASGRINGSVDQGNGDDRFEISGGVVTGQVQQGEGVDHFAMTGGEINTLNQGGALDRRACIPIFMRACGRDCRGSRTPASAPTRSGPSSTATRQRSAWASSRASAGASPCMPRATMASRSTGREPAVGAERPA